MGACDFELIKIGHYKSAQDAFYEATREALFEHGRSTTELTKVICAADLPRPGTKAWKKYIKDTQSAIPQWECYALEIRRGKYFDALKESVYGKKRKRNLKAYLLLGLTAC